MNNDGKTILYTMLKECHFGAAEFLLEQGANPLAEKEMEFLDGYNKEVYKDIEADLLKLKQNENQSDPAEELVSAESFDPNGGEGQVESLGEVITDMDQLDQGVLQYLRI